MKVKEKIYVAQAGDTQYETLAEAIAIGGEVKVLADVTLAEGLTVESGKTVTLNLNGKTVSGTANTDADYAALIHVENGANLTITGNGKISYAAGSCKSGAAVWTEGNLVLESGTIETDSSWSIGFAVDVRPNAWNTAYTNGTSFVMNGGKVVSAKSAAVRVGSSSASGKDVSADFTMNGGTVEGYYAVSVQPFENDARSLSLTVNGGTLTSTDSTYNAAVFVTVEDEANGNAANTKVKIANGAINGAVLFYTNNTVKAENVAITGGTFSTYGVYSYDTASFPVISGGTFGNGAKEYVDYYKAEGYEVVENEDGTVSVAEKVEEPAEEIKVGYNLTLESYIDFSFFMYKTDVPEGATVTITRNGVAKEITSWENYNETMWRFRYADVAPAEYQDELILTVKDSEGNVIVEETQSIKSYAETRVDKAGEDADMMQALLAYCAACETYFATH